MRIGIDLQVLENTLLTGIGKYSLALAQNLLKLQTDHRFVFFVPEAIGRNKEIREIKMMGGEVVELPGKKLPFWTRHVTYARIMAKQKLDVLHGPANTTPLFYFGKTVITIHDLAIYKHPEWFPKNQWLSTRVIVPLSIRRARRIIVPSEATARDLQDIFSVSSEKIAIIPLGVDLKKFKSQKPRPRNMRIKSYILFVGTNESRKNVKGLIAAYKLLPEGIRNNYDLVIAGIPARNRESIIDNRLSIRDKIKLLGYVPDENLPELYQNASVFVYPSFYEGFGLPVLEAMAAGVPVVTSKFSSLPEVAGEVAVLVDPSSSHQIAKEIVKLIRDEAYSSEISDRGLKRAGLFGWNNMAEKTLSVYLP